jgi:hypothetical protein
MKRALVILALALAGCGGGSEEAANPAPTPSPTPDPAAVLEKLDPCELLTAAERRRLGVRNNSTPADIAGAQTCRWTDTHRHRLLGFMTATVAIMKGVGLEQVTPRPNVPPFKVGSHDALQYLGAGSFCGVALGISDDIRVDVLISVSADIAKSCVVSRRAAELVEPKLP